MKEKTIDHEYTQNIVCPYCGYEDRDSWEYTIDDDVVECGECGEDFHYERIVTVDYVTKKISRVKDYPQEK